MRTPQSPVNVHRLARLIVCARAMIVWAAAVLLDGLLANRRRIRQRYGMLSIDKLTRVVRNLMIARVSQLVSKRQTLRPYRAHAPSGFRRRRRARSVLRSIGGVRLRHFMNHGGIAQRFARLIHMIHNLDGYARAFLLRRGLRGFNRLIATMPVRPPHQSVRALAAFTPALADTS